MTKIYDKNLMTKTMISFKVGNKNLDLTCSHQKATEMDIEVKIFFILYYIQNRINQLLLALGSRSWWEFFGVHHRVVNGSTSSDPNPKTNLKSKPCLKKLESEVRYDKFSNVPKVFWLYIFVHLR